MPSTSKVTKRKQKKRRSKSPVTKDNAKERTPSTSSVTTSPSDKDGKSAQKDKQPNTPVSVEKLSEASKKEQDKKVEKKITFVTPPKSIIPNTDSEGEEDKDRIRTPRKRKTPGTPRKSPAKPVLQSSDSEEDVALQKRSPKKRKPRTPMKTPTKSPRKTPTKEETL